MKHSKELRQALKDYKKLAAGESNKADKQIVGIVHVLCKEIVELNGRITTMERQLNKVL